ncbi:UNKNOWN [Stylonychia lemnae]|uniref:T-cell immunomodulatory protein TIP C2 domain-containing protein n=1 Tax=Stylonychia lemnae TaxID=5949 RepID=A0A078B1N8_STYLE|nr:UNKNOWN [Stylonychia lemnae]|eukprot:CDW88409.1 UNKNOWN [Stylonychia lemnae]
MKTIYPARSQNSIIKFTILGIVSTALFLSNTLAAEADYGIEAFHTKWFWTRPKEGFYSVDVGLKSTASDANFKGNKAFAFGDLNNDKLNDLVTVSEDQKSFQPYFYNSESFKFTSSPLSTAVPDGFHIVSIFINKEQTGQQYLFVTMQNDVTNVAQIKLYVPASDSNSYVDNPAVAPIMIQYKSQPFFFDVNGDRKNEIMFNSPDQVDGNYVVKVGAFNSQNQFVVKDFSEEYAILPSQDSNCKTPIAGSLSIPHSGSFLDIDGDCMPDLFLTKTYTNPEGVSSTQYEIYIQKKFNNRQRYCMVQTDDFKYLGGAESQIPLINFADMDRDGMTDMVFFRDSAVHTFYNQYIANSASETNLCKTAYESQHLVNNRFFGYFNNIGNDDKNIQKQTMYFSDDKIIELTDVAKDVPGRIQIADIDADGFPDVLLTGKILRDSKDISQTAVFMNSKASVETTSQLIIDNAQGASKTQNGITKDSRRELSEQTGDYKIQDIAGLTSTGGAFIDIDEDGRIDVLLQKTSDKQITDLLCVYNNYVKDTFFLKALMVNTVNAYGNALSGPSYRLIVTDLNDEKFVVIGSQLTQSAYNSIQMPYCYLGVGRSNNYVESFTAAYSIEGERSIRVWTPIIPNSQLIIFAPEQNVNNWTLELFINPTSSLALIVIACLICLFIIGVVIIILHIGEKKEDQKNKQKAFDYL